MVAYHTRASARSRARTLAYAWLFAMLWGIWAVPGSAHADIILSPSCSGAAIDLGTVTPGMQAITTADCGITFGSNTDVAGLRLYQSDGIGAAMGTIPDFVPATSDWISGSAAFGACLRAENAGVAPTWTLDGDGNCTASNSDPWQAVLPTSTTAAEVAHTTASGINNATVQLRFGLRTAPSTPVGVLSAPLVIEALAPNVSAPTNVTLPTISGTTSPGQTLTATPGTWTGSPTGYAYQWQRCTPGCSDIVGATSTGYVLVAGDLGATVTVRVTATNASGSGTATSSPTATITNGPINLLPPAITGDTQTGQTLTADTGTWTGSPTSYAYQWLRCDSAGASCAPIAGATSTTYLLGAADLGATIRVAVTASNATGSGTANSMNTTMITDPPASLGYVSSVTTKTSATTSVMTLSAGIPAQHFLVLSATWLGTGITPTVTDTRGNTWNVDVLGTGTGMMTLTASTYVTTALSTSDTITLTTSAAVAARGVTVNEFKNVSPQYSLDVATSMGGNSTAIDTSGGTTSDPVELVVGTMGSNGPASDTFTAGAPYTQLVGTGTTGNGAASNVMVVPEYLVTTSVGYVDATGTLNVARNWEADLASYRADPGSAPTNMVAPTISGSANEGTTLTASSAWSGRPQQLTYQWRRCDAGGANCVDIAGATSTSYLLVRADIGSTVRVVATARNGRGTTTATSSASGLVQGVAPADVSLPSVSGTVFTGNVLTANPGFWNGTAPLTYTYQWQRCNAGGSSCVPVAGQTASTYTVVAADDGNSVRVTVTATNSCSTGCGTASATSSSAPYVYPPANTALPTISGLPEQQRKQTSSTGSWTYSPSSYAYQWRRCDSAGTSCVDIAGATTTWYRPQASDLGFTLRIVVTASNAAGSASATSVQTAVIGATVCGMPEATTDPSTSPFGSVTAGTILNGSAGTWICSPSMSYQWYNDLGPIAGATSINYKTQSSDICYFVYLNVTATTGSGSVTQSAGGSLVTPASGPMPC